MKRFSDHFFTFFFSIMLSVVMTGCYFQPDRITTKGLDKSKKSKKQQSEAARAIVTSVAIVNNQLIINGDKLEGVQNIKVTGASSFEENFAIESKTTNKLVANGLKNISFLLGNVFSLILSDAYGAATFSITFTLQDGAVTASKLSDMGAGIGQILRYNGTTWIPGDLGALTYAGNWNATTNTPDLSGGGSAGEYYIINDPGTHNLLGGPGTDSWAVGDWVVWNDVGGRWEKIDNATNVTSFNGRNGVVVPQTNDYTWAQIDKSTSSLSDISDVDITVIDNGDVLKWNGSSWIAGSPTTTASITSNEIANGSIVDADISNSAAIDQSKISNLSTDLASKLSLSGGTMTGPLTMGTNHIVTSGLVDGVDISALNTQVTTNTANIATNTASIASKEGSLGTGEVGEYLRHDKTWVTLNTDAVTEGTNLYYTAARARTDLIGSISNGATTIAPSSDAVFDALALKENSLGFTPLNVAGDNMTGALQMNAQNEVRFADSGSTNYVALRAPASLGGSNTVYTLPSTDGASGEVLTTNGAGTLSWTSVAGGGDITAVVAGTGLTDGGASGSVTLNVDVGTTAGKIVQLDPTGKLPAVDGSQLTNLPDGLASVIGSFAVGADSTVTNTDTVETAIEKLQGQVDGNNTDIATNAADIATNATNIATNVTNIATNATDIATNSTGIAGKVSKAGDTMTGALEMSDQSEVIFYEKATNGTSYVALKAPISIVANTVFTLPAGYGSSGQVLSTDASGNLSWVNKDPDVDNSTIEYDGSGRLQVKNDGITDAKINSVSISKLTRVVEKKSANYTVTAADNNKIFIATATMTFSLPSCGSTVLSGFSISVKRFYVDATNHVLLDPNGSEKIEGVTASLSINKTEGSAVIVCDGTEWWAISRI